MGIYHSFQTVEAYELMKKQGYLHCTEEYADYWFIEAYNWLIPQMNKRLPVKIKSGHYPIWVWDSFTGASTKSIFENGQAGVWLTLDIPDNHVLLSDYDAWHSVLNNHVLAYTDEEWEDFDMGQCYFTKELSWERVFDLKALASSENWCNSDQWVQGVTPYIHMNQVVEVEYISTV